ncbi:MAG: DUF1045 domain-containing protein [Pseudomonadota bacterium]
MTENDRSEARYGIYFAPSTTSDLWLRGSAWLGRDAASGAPLDQPTVASIAPPDLARLTDDPRRYGLHATLKAPFHLRAGVVEQDLVASAHELASTIAPFEMSPLSVQLLHGFLCLRPTATSTALHALAGQCVAHFDPLRAGLTPSDRERRMRTRLSDRQIAHLNRWGYPFVFDEYRFHITLTSRVNDADTLSSLLAFLTEYFGELPETPVDDFCLYRQPNRTQPFRIIERIPLIG